MHSPHAPRHSKKYTPINSRNLLKIKLPAPFRCASSAPNPRFLIVQRVTFFRVLFGLVTDCNDYIVWEKMIKGIIIVNNHGKPRLVKFYQSVESEALQQTVIRRVFTQVAQRPDSFCNYLEGIVPEWGEHIKLIYRHYATLYFVFAVDAQESDLGILDLIQVFVEALDKCFENVCELDLIFHSDRVHYVLDEIVMGGMVLETNISAILQSIKDQGKMHSESLSKVDASESASQIRDRLQYNW